MSYLIIYEKPNHEIVFRVQQSIPFFKIGDFNGYGWEVLDIQQEYAGKFITKTTFIEKMKIEYRKRMKRRHKIELLKRILEKLSS